jgi:hypothetical protein
LLYSEFCLNLKYAMFFRLKLIDFPISTVCIFNTNQIISDDHMVKVLKFNVLFNIVFVQ